MVPFKLFIADFVGFDNMFEGTINAELRLCRLDDVRLLPLPFPVLFMIRVLWFLSTDIVGLLGGSLPDSEDAPDAEVVASVEELGKMMAWFNFTPRRTALTRCL